MQNLLTKLAARPALAIFACSLLLFCSGTWILPLTDRDEPRFAEASREMLQRGDFIGQSLGFGAVVSRQLLHRGNVAIR